MQDNLVGSQDALGGEGNKRPWWKSRGVLVDAFAALLVVAASFVLVFFGSRHGWSFLVGYFSGMGVVILYALATSLFSGHIDIGAAPKSIFGQKKEKASTSIVGGEEDTPQE